MAKKKIKKNKKQNQVMLPKNLILLLCLIISLVGFLYVIKVFTKQDSMQVSVPISVPSSSPTLVAANFTEQQSERIGWRRLANERSNLSISFPDTWKIKGKTTYGAEEIQITSPNNFVIDFSLGLYGIGGYAPSLAPDKFVYEPVTFMNKTFYLSIRLDTLLQEGKPVTLAGVYETPQPLWFIKIDNLGTDGGTQGNLPHGGYTGIKLYHVDNNSKTLFKSVEDFKTEDYQIAKEILSTTRLAN